MPVGERSSTSLEQGNGTVVVRNTTPNPTPGAAADDAADDITDFPVAGAWASSALNWASSAASRAAEAGADLGQSFAVNALYSRLDGFLDGAPGDGTFYEWEPPSDGQARIATLLPKGWGVVIGVAALTAFLIWKNR